MKHLNEQTRAMAQSITDASLRKGIQWTRVTWYSWWLAVFLFLFVLPALSFYVGMQYQQTLDVLQG
jgi:hypothetical protein